MLPKTRGGEFLFRDLQPEEIFTPEDLSEEHKDVARAAQEFWNGEVEPHLEAIAAGDHDAAIAALRKSAELGLTAILTPEAYGGMEMDLPAAMVVAEQVARDGSYAAWHGAHSGIGTTPLVLFGTEDQKRRYLPKLSSAEWIGAYCLSEAHAGSDALAAKTRAERDGDHYVLNGQKMWITNGGRADLFTVFAKVNGEQFTAFLVEAAWPGVSRGAEEKKMGIKGSSTCAIYFDNVRVPKENVLGEIGRGHIIAFNILNLGRLKLGPFAVGAAKQVLALSLRYARERRAFGSAIAEFGAIRHKLAEMAIRIFAAESMSWRVVGQVEALLEGFAWSEPDAANRYLKAVEEFAPECSMVKVFASEMLDYVADEGVQIHGGYGYHADYRVERAYRDSRINRIFEGTNEINRLLATGMLLKRAAKGQLDLAGAARKAAEAAMAPASADGPENARLVRQAKQIVLLLMGAAWQRYLTELDKQQEVLTGITDCMMDAFAMESVWLRAERLGGRAADTCDVFLRCAMERIGTAARAVSSACAEGDALRTQFALLRKLTRYEPVDVIAARRRIAAGVLQS
ncbi:MAG: acyl-CoA dehydrogenase family protein [Bryobacterales bacterium]|nr:acyl-CoA dehydrogenase family protein [Bryobacterales bacterium]